MVSLSGFSMNAKDEEEGRTYIAPEPDNANSALHSVVEKPFDDRKFSSMITVCARSCQKTTTIQLSNIF